MRELGIFDILILKDKDGYKLYSREDAIEIIDLLKKLFDYPFSDEDYQKLLDQIPKDRKLRINELFEILRNSPVSIWADYASLELNQEVKSKSYLRCLPAWFYRWLFNGKAKK